MVAQVAVDLEQMLVLPKEEEKKGGQSERAAKKAKKAPAKKKAKKQKRTRAQRDQEDLENQPPLGSKQSKLRFPQLELSHSEPKALTKKRIIAPE